ncbi:KCTD12 [Symbiodinium natans]|uniref:KCTD12 protein n=1 Tax=Symbiodinium natans TaxID=878477 RepID=A0A812P9H6_9DINO|nr:KCTD12 [Symbiodinium natans]
MAMDSSGVGLGFAEATAALQEHLDCEERHLQKMRRQMEEDLDAKLPSKGEEEKNCPTPSARDTVRLNVGGNTGFTTRRDTLTAIPGSRLALLFSGRWDKALRRDENGRVFLDVDPVQFRALLAWLVDLKRLEPDTPAPSPPVDSLPQSYRAGFLSLCSYLCCRDACISQKQISELTHDELTSSVQPLQALRELSDSTLVSRDQVKQLNTWLKATGNVTGEPSLNLLYRASRDGFSHQAFHQKCDAQGPTVLVARSAGGHLFGGYTETPWDSSVAGGQYKPCTESFLFRLAGPGTVQPSKHKIFQNHPQGIYCHPGHSATFGGGHDMRVYPQGAAAQVAFSMGNTYSSASPQGNFTFLAETQQAVVTDVEVFAVAGYMDLRSASQSLLSHAKKLKTELEPSEQELLDKALAVCTAALDQGNGLLAAQASMSSWCAALDEEAQFLAQFMGTPSDIVCLNVGGQLVSTLHSTLTFFSDSALAKKFAENWTLQDEEVVEGGIFFDEDPDLFQVVLLHLRLGRLLGNTFSPKLPSGKRAPWLRLLKYLNLQTVIKESWDSDLLAGESERDKLLSMLCESTPDSTREVSLDLLYRASRDGFSHQAFHQKCDAQGPTVLVARSARGHLFGGYTETPWDSSVAGGQYKACSESFLFRLAGPGTVQPSKHKIFQNHPNGIYCHPGHSATFGGGHDMRVFSQGAAAKVAFSIGNTYSSASPQGNFTFLAETQQAVVTDVEVFAVTRQ